MGSKGNLLGLIDDSKVSLSGEFNRNVLEGLVGSIDQEHFEIDIVLVDINNSFSIDRIRISGKLDNLFKSSGKIFGLGFGLAQKEIINFFIGKINIIKNSFAF